nr:MAG TPA: hypothetical protein [Caudoviricetes sp.]
MRNPVEHATLPKEEYKTRDIWTAEVLQKALEACDDDILRLAINLTILSRYLTIQNSI